MSGRSDVACSHLRADGAVTCCDLAGNALTVTGLLTAASTAPSDALEPARPRDRSCHLPVLRGAQI